MYTVPTTSDKRFQELMRLLDRIQSMMQDRHLNQTEYQSVTNLRLRINAMRFGTPAELEYPHWAEAYNRINEMLDVNRRVPIAGGPPSQRAEKHEPDAIAQLLEEEFKGLVDEQSPQQQEVDENEGPDAEEIPPIQPER